MLLRDRRLTRGAAALTVALGLVGAASAQTPAPAQPAPAPAPVTAGWNEGFFIQTPDGDNRLQIGFVAQADGRSAGIFNGNPADGTGTSADVDTNNRKNLATAFHEDAKSAMSAKNTPVGWA